MGVLLCSATVILCWGLELPTISPTKEVLSSEGVSGKKVRPLANAWPSDRFICSVPPLLLCSIAITLPQSGQRSSPFDPPTVRLAPAQEQKSLFALSTAVWIGGCAGGFDSWSPMVPSFSSSSSLCNGSWFSPSMSARPSPASLLLCYNNNKQIIELNVFKTPAD